MMMLLPAKAWPSPNWRRQCSVKIHIEIVEITGRKCITVWFQMSHLTKPLMPKEHKARASAPVEKADAWAVTADTRTHHLGWNIDLTCVSLDCGTELQHLEGTQADTRRTHMEWHLLGVRKKCWPLHHPTAQQLLQWCFGFQWCNKTWPSLSNTAIKIQAAYAWFHHTGTVL